MTIQMTTQHYLAMGDREFDRALLFSLPKELRRQIAQASEEEDDYDRSEKKKLIERITRSFSAELVEALCERECKKRARAILADSYALAELFDVGSEEVPRHLWNLTLPFACWSDGCAGRYLKWREATWTDIQAQRGDLADHHQWYWLDEVEELSRIVEPVMRDHPRRTLGEALLLIAQEGDARRKQCIPR